MVVDKKGGPVIAYFTPHSHCQESHVIASATLVMLNGGWGGQETMNCKCAG